jgi:replication fork protection complex subunit Tof1/Swi1
LQLGGSGADEEGRYVLGDDALACLRDLKRWLKLYDEKANRLDVARCLAESNLVSGDLLQILAAWPENATDDRVKAKIALACLELLVPLTWPLEKTKEMTVNHHRHTPYLQLAQLGYKRSIVNFDGARILHTAVRVALPSMALAVGERSARDQGIIKLVLYFLRNIAMIAPPPNVEYDGDEAEISRSATIDAYDYQDIFHLLLTLSSSMGEDFNVQDVVVMEVIFHMIKGVNIEKLFMNEAQLDSKKADELLDLRNQEAGLLRGYARTAPTRHNRFGTMIWVQGNDKKMSTVSGQDALIDPAKTLDKMDKSKKYKPPRRAIKGETGPLDFDTPVSLSVRANKNLRTFVEDFLDSGFNPLFQHIRKAIDREAERVVNYHPRQFFFLVGWFLEAERVRRKSKKPSKGKKTTVPEDTDSFSLVASVLNQEMFITLNRFMETTYEEKSWQDMNAAMKCFTQILLTVQEMSESKLEDDQEIAENILNRIFYEETTHDRIANIIRYYKDQGFGYLDSCTELVHVYLRILENYSKQNADLQVRSKRRARRKKKADNASVPDDDNNLEDNISEAEDEVQAARTSSERKFDFKRFAARFLLQGCVDTFVTFCRYYQDLNLEQLKRAHRFFYRVAFKMEMSVMLFRVDIIALFHKMIKGPEGLDPASPVFREWDELVRQLIKRCTRKIQERPELIVEMLFSKTNGTAHYLEYGYEKQTASSKPRAAAELEVKPGFEWEQQVGVVVSALLDRNEGDHLEWLKSQLSSAEVQRRSWESANSLAASMESETTAEDVIQPIEPEKLQVPSISQYIISYFKVSLSNLVKASKQIMIPAEWHSSRMVTSDFFLHSSVFNDLLMLTIPKPLGLSLPHSPQTKLSNPLISSKPQNLILQPLTMDILLRTKSGGNLQLQRKEQFSMTTMMRASITTLTAKNFSSNLVAQPL